MAKKRGRKFKETWGRSLLKAVSYRVLIVILDFVVIYSFTKRVDVATAFVIISNIYTTFFYYVHERIWNNVKWGKKLAEVI